jgi:hypothetical protein
MLLGTGAKKALILAAVVAVAGPALTGTGAYAASSAGKIILVSASASGEPGNGLSAFGLSTSADGRYVAFASMATNLEPSDPDNIVDIYVKDLLTGAVRLASMTADGVKANAFSERPSISADGQRVAFTSAANNLSPDDTDGYFDVFVKDLRTGALTLASVTEDGRKAAGGSESAALCADGLAVAFTSRATNLVAGRDRRRIPRLRQAPRHRCSRPRRRRHHRAAGRADGRLRSIAVRRRTGRCVRHRRIRSRPGRHRPPRRRVRTRS